MKSQSSQLSLETSPVEDRGSERDCIARVLAGDTAAFRSLVETYEPAVFGVCRRRLAGSEAEAEDLSQEAFIRAYRRLSELKDPDRFGPWLYQIARSLCRDRVRHLIAERRALWQRVELSRWESIPDSERDDDRVASALQELPAREREVLELKYFEGLSYREIADRLGLSFARVDHLVREARARLGRRLQVARQRDRSL